MNSVVITCLLVSVILAVLLRACHMKSHWSLLKRIIITLFVLVGLICLAGVWAVFIGYSNPANRKTIGEIPPPRGFERIEVAPNSFGAYIRSFPLQRRGSMMKHYDGSLAYGQYFGYAVLDLPLISENEQCCDAVQRMRSEYLFAQKRYSEIHFQSFQNGTVRYNGGGDHKELHKYLRRVYGMSNTSTLRHEMKKKRLADIAPGDVLVYEAGARHSVGHAVLVTDVAINPKTGEKAIMVAQSSMPALTMHIVRNVTSIRPTPWTIIKDDDSDVLLSFVRFHPEDLRTWN